MTQFSHLQTQFSSGRFSISVLHQKRQIFVSESYSTILGRVKTFLNIVLIPSIIIMQTHYQIRNYSPLSNTLVSSHDKQSSSAFITHTYPQWACKDSWWKKPTKKKKASRLNCFYPLRVYVHHLNIQLCKSHIFSSHNDSAAIHSSSHCQFS